MKKTSTLAFMACAFMTMNAQTVFNISPDLYWINDTDVAELSLLGERMSSNGKYVVGSDQSSQVPFIWNTEADKDNIKLLILTDKGIEYIFNDDYSEIIGEEEVDYPRSGAFHAVSDNGIAVGGTTNNVTYVTYPCLYDMNSGKFTELACDEGIDYEGNPMVLGAEAYGITADGSTIAGFRFQEDGWNVQGCVWTNGGQTRTDLPAPSSDELGVDIDYISARGISTDGSVVWGYAQDANTGSWIACHWTKNAEGAYEGHSWASKYYQTTILDEETYEPIPVENPNPWHSFEPVAMSDNGEWMTLILTKEVALGPWAQACNYAARLNLKSGALEVLNMGQDAEGNDVSGPELFGISDNGTCVGRLTALFIDEENAIFEEHIDAVIWPAGSQTCTKLKDLTTDDAYTEAWTASALSYINGEGTKVMGYASDEMYIQTTFTLDLSKTASIANTLAPNTDNATYDLAGRRVATPAKGLYITNGKKVIR